MPKTRVAKTISFSAPPVNETGEDPVENERRFRSAVTQAFTRADATLKDLGGEGGIDHGALDGLEDDDHPQYLKKAGDTMTGALVLSADPANDLEAATKKYVDEATGGGGDHGALAGLEDDDHPQYFDVVRGDERYLRLTGGTLSGALTLNGAPSSALHAATKQYVDDNIPAVPRITRGSFSTTGAVTGGSGFSVTRTGNGTYNVQFSTNQPNSTYTAVMSLSAGAAGNAAVATKTTFAMTIETKNSSGDTVDRAVEFIVMA